MGLESDNFIIFTKYSYVISSLDFSGLLKPSEIYFKTQEMPGHELDQFKDFRNNQCVLVNHQTEGNGQKRENTSFSDFKSNENRFIFQLVGSNLNFQSNS